MRSPIDPLIPVLALHCKPGGLARRRHCKTLTSHPEWELYFSTTPRHCVWRQIIVARVKGWHFCFGSVESGVVCLLALTCRPPPHQGGSGSPSARPGCCRWRASRGSRRMASRSAAPDVNRRKDRQEEGRGRRQHDRLYKCECKQQWHQNVRFALLVFCVVEQQPAAKRKK